MTIGFRRTNTWSSLGKTQLCLKAKWVSYYLPLPVYPLILLVFGFWWLLIYKPQLNTAQSSRAGVVVQAKYIDIIRDAP